MVFAPDTILPSILVLKLMDIGCPPKCNNIVNNDEKVNVYGYGIEAIIQPPAGRRVRSLLSPSVSAVSTTPDIVKTPPTEEDNKTTARLRTWDVKYFLSDNWALRADVRHVIPIDTDFDRDTMH
ncbi:MAG: hypothetical protein MZV70_24590 [Desulfobacterales bacterium]|nr:hypothetical protein [Desulfobacterales bacterium]